MELLPVSLQCPYYFFPIILPQKNAWLPGQLSSALSSWWASVSEGPQIPRPGCPPLAPFRSQTSCVGSSSHPSGGGGEAAAEFIRAKDDSSCTGNSVTLIMCLFFPFPASYSLPPTSFPSFFLPPPCVPSHFYLLPELPTESCPPPSSPFSQC